MGFHFWHLLIVAAIALLVFGPKRLPEMGGAIGKSITSFRKGMKDANASKEKEQGDDQPDYDEQKQLYAKRAELEALERELAVKKAAMNTREAEKRAE